MTWAQAASQYGRQKQAEEKDQAYILVAAVSIHQRAVRTTFLAKRAVKIQQRKYFILEEFGFPLEAPRKGLQSPDYLDILPESFLVDFLRLMSSTFKGEEA